MHMFPIDWSEHFIGHLRPSIRGRPNLDPEEGYDSNSSHNSDDD